MTILYHSGDKGMNRVYDELNTVCLLPLEASNVGFKVFHACDSLF